MSEVNRRLLLIPLIFLVLKLWGTGQFFFSLSVSSKIKNGCIPPQIHTTFFVLEIFQVCVYIIESVDSISRDERDFH